MIARNEPETLPNVVPNQSHNAQEVGDDVRDRVKTWLQRVAPLATWPNNWSGAVQRQKQSFPQSLLVKFVKLIARSWAKWLIKDALQSASKTWG